MTDDQIDAVSKALSSAWNLGQIYWNQADSEYASQNRKSDETRQKFLALVDETKAALSRIAEAQPVARVPAGYALVPSEPTPAMSAAGLSVSEAEHDPAGVYRAMLAGAPQAPGVSEGAQHSDDAAVDRFASAMKEKLRVAREKGRAGWEHCDPIELSLMLREHVEKGDPRDVANFCMMLWHRGFPIASHPTARAEGGEAVIGRDAFYKAVRAALRRHREGNPPRYLNDEQADANDSEFATALANHHAALAAARDAQADNKESE